MKMYSVRMQKTDFLSSNTSLYFLCPPPCGLFLIMSSPTGELSYYKKKDSHSTVLTYIPSKPNTRNLSTSLFIYLSKPSLVMPSTDQQQSAPHVTMLPPLPYLPRRLQGVLLLSQGYLILRGASRLDAFSVYPVPAWLLCHDIGMSTDTPAASPPRSSRTKGSSSQISYAHAGQGPNCLTTF